MELHIPAIHGPGGSRFYFVDRWQEFSIYSIDFVPITSASSDAPALAGNNYFGVVQYIGPERSADWMAYYQNLFGFTPIPDSERFGILPKGMLMKSACGKFLWQLIEPDPTMDYMESQENLQRIGIGASDVGQAVVLLKARGVEFVESEKLHPEDRGALTRTVLGSVSFELVHQTV
jgi:4-hydroxyphenylpyruvate dioxygenase